MLKIEKGGDQQIEDELYAYNPLIPKGNDIVATLMFGFGDVNQRKKTLEKLGHVWDSVYFTFSY